MEATLKQIGSHIRQVATEVDLTDEVRARAAQTAPPSDGAWLFHYASMTRDAADPQTIYLAADRPADPEPHKLLVFSANTGAPTCEVRPFAATDREAIRNFATTIDPSFLPRPQQEQPAVAVGNRHPEVSLPAAFDAFGRILNDTGVNMASTVQLSATREMTIDEAIAARDGEDPTAIGHTRVSIEHLYHAGLWAAVRAGWRHGYTVCGHLDVLAEIPVGIRGRLGVVLLVFGWLSGVHRELGFYGHRVSEGDLVGDPLRVGRLGLRVRSNERPLLATTRRFPSLPATGDHQAIAATGLAAVWRHHAQLV